MDLWQRIFGTKIDRPQIDPPVAADAPLVIGPNGSKPIVIGPDDRAALWVNPEQVIRIGPAAEIVVQPPHRGLWDERGWTWEKQNGQRFFQGYYQVYHSRTGERRTWPGRIFVRGRDVSLYIAGPPQNLNRHPKWPCFHQEEGRWFRLNWHRAARNVDDAILYMERILDEVINRY